MSSLSSNNVIYGFQVAFDDSDVENTVIDSNELAQELVNEQERIYKAALMEEERARRLEILEANGGQVPEGMDPAEFLDLSDSIMGVEPEPEEPSIDYVAQAQEEAQQILEAARAEAAEIMAAAETNAEALKSLARQDGNKEGYNEGIQQAALELQEKEQKMDEELEYMRNQYHEAQVSLSREITEMCLPIFEKVFGASLFGKKDVIFHLLDNCISGIEPSHQMQIKVSENNVAFIKLHKDEIQSKLGSEVVLDVIADALMDDNSCIIETDGGLFDCGIDTELDELIRAIRALG